MIIHIYDLKNGILKNTIIFSSVICNFYHNMSFPICQRKTQKGMYHKFLFKIQDITITDRVIR